MPQPLSRIVPKATISLRRDALSDKPEMAAIVTEIFAAWAQIEHGLSLLLVRILGAVESPAIAMYSVLTAQHLQSKALEAAAKAALSSDSYQVFLAVTSTIESAAAPRNHLAHWIWGISPEKPEFLVLADPKMLKQRSLKIAEKLFSGAELPELIFDETLTFDTNHTLCYSKDELLRAKTDLEDANEALLVLEFYFQPRLFGSIMPKAKSESDERIRELLLERLNDIRLFREALARIRAGQQSTPQPTPGSPAPKPGGK